MPTDIAKEVFHCPHNDCNKQSPSFQGISQHMTRCQYFIRDKEAAKIKKKLASKKRNANTLVSEPFHQDVDFGEQHDLLASTIDHGNQELGTKHSCNLRTVESLSERAKKAKIANEICIPSILDEGLERMRELRVRREKDDSDEDTDEYEFDSDSSSDDEYESELAGQSIAGNLNMSSIPQPPPPLAKDIVINKDDDWETVWCKLRKSDWTGPKWASGKLSLSESYLYFKPKKSTRNGTYQEDYFGLSDLKLYVIKHYGWEDSDAAPINSDLSDDDDSTDNNRDTNKNSKQEGEENTGNDDVDSDPFSPDIFTEEDMDSVTYEAVHAHASGKHKLKLSSSEMAQLDLLVLLRRSGCPLNLHDRIIDWITTYETREPGLFRTNKLLHRDSLITKISKMYGVSNRKPALREMIYNDRTITIPVFPFVHELLSLLNDPAIMNDQNIAEGYDIFTGKINGKRKIWQDDTIKEEDMMSIPIPTDPKTKIGEVVLGTKFQKSIDRFCRPDSNHMAIPLIFFFDKANLDFHGGLASSPLIFTIAFFLGSARARIQFWRLLAIIPNLGIGRGKSCTMTADQKEEERHMALKIAFEDLQAIFNKGGIRTKIQGKDVVLKIWIHFIIGDTSGHNELCGQANCTNLGSQNAVCRCCKCSLPELSNDEIPQCEAILMSDIEPELHLLRNARKKAADENINNLEDIEGVKESKDRLKALSHRPIESNVFHDMPMGNMARGIRGCTNFEEVHVFGQGIYLYMAQATHDFMGTSSGGGGESKTKINTIFSTLKRSLSRQSERDFPRTSVRFCYTDGTKLTAEERKGNTLLLLLVFLCQDGLNTISNYLPRHNVVYNDCIEALEGVLCYERWIAQPNEAWQLVSCYPKVQEVMTKIKKGFPRGDKGNNWDIPKFHGGRQMPVQIMADGDGSNWTSSHGENFHKSFSKRNAKNTQMRYESLASQMAIRVKENIALDVASSANVNDLMFQPYEEYTPITNNSADGVKSYMSAQLPLSNKLDCKGGSCSITIYPKTNDDPHRKRKTDIMWKNKAKHATKAAVFPELIYAVGTYAENNGWEDIIHITSFTTIKKTDPTTGKEVRYRCDTDYRGYPWRDWGIFNTYDELTRGQLCPGLICGFVTFDDAGFTTPGNETEKIQSTDSENIIDPNLYIVLRAAKDCINFDDKFVNRFELEREKTYILKLSSLIGPLAVLPDIHSKGKTGMDRYNQDVDHWLTVKPTRMWGDHFGKRIKWDTDKLGEPSANVD